MVPKISLQCGPINDQRLFNFKLNFLRRRIGVLVSGGLDSALLYYLIQSMVDERYSVTPFIITRDNDGSDLYAQPIIDYVHKILNKPKQNATLLYITETNSELQVVAGMRELKKHNINLTYIGLIETLPEHSIGVPNTYKPTDTYDFVYPFKNLNKTHIVDLIIKLGQKELFNITHSCVYKRNRCGICNRCRERQYAFDELDLIDSGKT